MGWVSLLLKMHSKLYPTACQNVTYKSTLYLDDSTANYATGDDPVGAFARNLIGDEVTFKCQGNMVSQSGDFG